MRLSAILFAASLAALAQNAPPDRGEGARPPMPEPKNLKLLKPDNLMATMHAFSAALDAKCDFCHVRGDFASDDNPHKETARKMIAMAREINAQFPDGKMHVTCYTCHRGAKEPATAPAEHGGKEAEHSGQ
jgi:hypothetical protein